MGIIVERIRPVRRPEEKIEGFKPKQSKTREKLVLKESNAKSLTALIASRISILKKDHKNSMNQKIYSPNDLILILEMLQNKNKEFNSVDIFGWHGKSSFKIEEEGEIIYVTKYQKPEKGAEPKEVKYEIDKKELLRLEKTIKEQLQNRESIGSRELGEIFYGENWDIKIFSNRKRHNLYTIALNVLDSQKKIIYNGGKIKHVEHDKSVKDGNTARDA